MLLFVCAYRVFLYQVKRNTAFKETLKLWQSYTVYIRSFHCAYKILSQYTAMHKIGGIPAIAEMLTRLIISNRAGAPPGIPQTILQVGSSINYVSGISYSVVL